MKRFPVAACVALAGLLFLASMLRSTGGRLSMPVDDAFIYFQYAKQAATGHPLVYQDGERATSGATSLPWTGLLSIGALLGFGGKAAIVFAMVLGGAAFAFAAKAAGDVQRSVFRDSGPGASSGALPLATGLVLLSGALQWGAWSGMEIALAAAAVAGAFRAWCDGGGRMSGGTAAWLAALAVVRPEGALLAGIAASFALVHAARDRAPRDAARAALPLAAAAAVPLVLLAATGDARSSGFLSKSLFAAPGAELLDVSRAVLLRAASLASSFFGIAFDRADGLGLYAYESETAPLVLAPVAAPLFLAGILPEIGRELRERRAGPGILGLAWIAAMFAATAVIEEPDAHFGRYQMPVLPLVLGFAAVGVARLGRALDGAPAGLAFLAPGLRALLIAAGLVQVAFFALAYGDACEDIDRMQIRLAERIREATEPSDVVAINDAGALAYFSGRRTLDLVGLTTPGFAGVWKQGSGALYESLEALPPERRPDWFCFFPNWFELDGLGIWQRKGSVRLLTPSIVDAEKVLARADWTLAGSGDAPRVALADPLATLRVVDRLDVADLASERAHDFRWTNREHGADAGTFALRSPFAARPGDEAIDGGRTIFGEASFTLARPAGAPALVIVRTVSGARERLLVSIDGEPARRVELYSPGGGSFHDAEIGWLPPGTGRARVTLSVVPEPAESAPLILAHAFAATVEPRTP